MSRLQIEFLPQPWWRQPSIRTLVLAGSLLAVAIVYAIDLRRHDGPLDAHLAQLSRPVSVATRTTTAVIRDPADVKRDASAIRQLNVPWGAIFSALEEAKPESVSILSVQPDADAANVQISAQATSYVEALGFVERLNRHAPLRSGFLSAHQLLGTTPDAPVRFDVVIDWRRP